MHTATGQGIEIKGQGGDQSFAFTGLHFGNTPRVEDHATEQLDIIVAQAGGAFAGFAYSSKGFRQDLVEHLFFDAEHFTFNPVDFDTGKFLFIGAENSQIFSFGAG